MIRLTEDEVWQRVGSYESSAVTDGLLSFGKTLIDANRDRAKHLEGKATFSVGYALAVIAFILSQERSVVSGWPVVLMNMASVCAALSLAGAALALRIRRYPWFSDDQWFQNQGNVLDDADSLKRSHVLAMHTVNAKLRETNDSKADKVLLAQLWLIAAGLLMAAWALVR